MTVELLTRTDGCGGNYEVVRVDGEDVDGEGPRFVSLHRLAAVAWGELGSLSDPQAVHHRVPVPWLNMKDNLVSLSWHDHGSVERRRQLARSVERSSSSS